MVSFPKKSTFSDRLAAEADPARLDAILPDLLRRYGLEPSVSGGENASPLPSRALPPGVWLPIADNHSLSVR